MSTDTSNASQKDTAIQIAISVALGGTAFFSFCILRPRWQGLYAARKQHTDKAASLPELPSTLFGWIPHLWRINQSQILAAAGLDAYVFLSFFKMCMTFLAISLFFGLVVFKPVHDHFPDKMRNGTNNTNNKTSYEDYRRMAQLPIDLEKEPDGEDDNSPPWIEFNLDHLWMYLVFAYFFTGVLLWLLVRWTRHIIDVRQDYLGTQSTIADRTFRLSGIPRDLRSEENIKEFVENLEIGNVENVSLIRDWKELDETVLERMSVLRKLEEAWTLYLGSRRVERNRETLPVLQPLPPGPEARADQDSENTGLLNGGQGVPYARTRPQVRHWYGKFKLRYRLVDAIDYYEEKLKKLDEKIIELRQSDFTPTALAFVTMDSVASCQMAAQAVLDPQPMQLLANTSPAPSDVVWPNTYLSRRRRMLKSWFITVVVLAFTIPWTVYLTAVGGLSNIRTIEKLFPGFADFLQEHPIARSLVETQLTTGLTTLLTVLVPFFYEWLSSQQGTISEGDVELSSISKNFFFTFFNFFIVFTIAKSASDLFVDLQSSSGISVRLAKSLADDLIFYCNFIILQGLGLLPFRLLEFGAVAMYPITRLGCKTPRDYAELVTPPRFSYGFFLPQVILIFIICVVYSVLRDSWKIQLAGLAYFVIGHYVYKYQLLYAMDNSQHTTGRAWMMICDRIFAGIVLFQLTMAGELLLKHVWKRAIAIVPLILATLWFVYAFRKAYQPLMEFIALRSIRRAEHVERSQSRGRTSESEGNTSSAPHLEEIDQAGQRYVNPSLVVPLENVWIVDQNARLSDGYSHASSSAVADANGS